jgi:hypothetical protein
LSGISNGRKSGVRFFPSSTCSKTFRQIRAYLDRLPLDPGDVNHVWEKFPVEELRKVE